MLGITFMHIDGEGGKMSGAVKKGAGMPRAIPHCVACPATSAKVGTAGSPPITRCWEAEGLSPLRGRGTRVSPTLVSPVGRIQASLGGCDWRCQSIEIRGRLITSGSFTTALDDVVGRLTKSELRGNDR